MAEEPPKKKAKTFPGDWICDKCGDLQFARNAFCRMCHGKGKKAEESTVAVVGDKAAAKGKGKGKAAGGKGKEGDWVCGSCGDQQFAKNSMCRMCGAAKPFTGGFGSGGYGGGGGSDPFSQMAQMMSTMNQMMGLMSGQAGGAGGGCGGCGGGDWYCPDCGDLQFARNATCRMCAGKAGNKKGKKPPMVLTGKAVEIKGEPELMVNVGGLALDADWRQLKDHMKKAGKVAFVKIITTDGLDTGVSKGYACVRYSTVEEVQSAIGMLNDTMLRGKKISVGEWTGEEE